MATPLATRKETGKKKVPSLLFKGTGHLPSPHPPVLPNPGESSQPLGVTVRAGTQACLKLTFKGLLIAARLGGTSVVHTMGDVSSVGQPA